MMVFFLLLHTLISNKEFYLLCKPIDCFNCKNEELENHDSQKMIECLTALSKKSGINAKKLECSNKHFSEFQMMMKHLNTLQKQKLVNQVEWVQTNIQISNLILF